MAEEKNNFISGFAKTVRSAWNEFTPAQKTFTLFTVIGVPTVTYLEGKKAGRVQTINGNNNKTVCINQTFNCIGDEVSKKISEKKKGIETIADYMHPKIENFFNEETVNTPKESETSEPCNL